MEFFKGTREKSLLFTCTLIAAKFLLSLFINLILFENEWLSPITQWSGGWIQPTLIVNLVQILLIVVIGVFILGVIKPRELGIEFKSLLQGICTCLIIWLCAQAYGFAKQGFSLHPIWQYQEPSLLIGSLLAQLFGNALFEELIYRAYLLPQTYFLIRNRFAQNNSVVLAVVFSQVIFALGHIPNRLYRGLNGWAVFSDFFILLGLGALFSLIYLITNNIFVSIGVHSLLNTPTALFQSPQEGSRTILVITILCLVVWELQKRLKALRVKEIS